MRSFAILLLTVTLLPGCSTAPASPAKAAKPGDCALECLRWVEQCNADPRGVYRCQRVCERFGEHCK